jgi:hypothetical protein
MAILYRHIRLDKNEVFYIGIGKDIKRAFNKSKRSKWWKSIIEKSEYEVDIMLDDLTWEEACEKEIEFIKLYGRKDLDLGTLVNMTDGGDGTINYKPSIESNIKRSLKLKGRIMPENQRKKLSNSLKGHKVSDKSLKALIERNKKPITEDQRKNMSDAQKRRYSNNIKKTYIKKGRRDVSGEKNPNAKQVFDKTTGIIYQTAKEAAEIFNINYTYFKSMLNGNSKNKTDLIYLEKN